MESQKYIYGLNLRSSVNNVISREKNLAVSFTKISCGTQFEP